MAQVIRLGDSIRWRATWHRQIHRSAAGNHSSRFTDPEPPDRSSRNGDCPAFPFLTRKSRMSPFPPPMWHRFPTGGVACQAQPRHGIGIAALKGLNKSAQGNALGIGINYPSKPGKNGIIDGLSCGTSGSRQCPHPTPEPQASACAVVRYPHPTAEKRWTTRPPPCRSLRDKVGRPLISPIIADPRSLHPSHVRASVSMPADARPNNLRTRGAHRRRHRFHHSGKGR